MLPAPDGECLARLQSVQQRNSPSCALPALSTLTHQGGVTTTSGSLWRELDLELRRGRTLSSG
jgi:hypothetical protein